MRRETKFVLILLCAWFCFAFAVGISGSFRQASAGAVALTVWGSTAAALFICWIFQAARDWTAMVDLRVLTGIHLVRFVGIYFLVLGAHGDLPQGFAKPAGIGDLVIATIAAAMLLVPSLRRRRLLQIWNVLGFIDIVFVVFSAMRFAMRDIETMSPLRELPLSLLPTFIVPLIITSHILIFVKLRQGTGDIPPSVQPFAAALRK
jgi:hypothetical protein